MKPLFSVSHRIGESCPVKWFQQIIERMKFEGANRILLVGCRKDNFWQLIDADRFEYREAIHLPHLNIEENKIDVLFPDLGDGILAIAALTHNLGLLIVFQHSTNELTCK